MAFVLLAVLLLMVGWLYVFDLTGVLPKGTWKRFSNFMLGRKTESVESEKTTYDVGAQKFDREVRPEDERAFHDVFNMMDVMNVKEVSSFAAYGHRTFYFTCGKCGQKNRLGTDLRKFKEAGCGKCHAKFASKPNEGMVN